MRNRDAEWQRDWFGKHVQMIPAANAQGYQYRTRPARAEYRPFEEERILRAIPAEGRIHDGGPAWAGAPQADYWLGTGKRKARGLRGWIRKWTKK